MSDTPQSSGEAAPAATAGSLLRRARQAQGLHIAALSASIKVSQRKLELLESDQFDQLPDATFTRALAQTVCRTLKVDAAPVLALLPPPKGHRLDEIAEGLNTPFRERPGRIEPKDWVSVASPLVWVAALVLLAAVFVYFMPASWVGSMRSAASGAVQKAPVSVTTATPVTVAPVAPAASTVTEVLPPVPEPAASVAMAEAPPLNPFEAAAAGVLQMHATAQSWIEVTDARGKTLIARLVQPGEAVGLDGDLPFKVKIGNAVAMQATFRGQPVDLGPFVRDSMAKLELK